MQAADPLTQGKYRDAFERKFGEYVDARYCFTTCNATAALEMAAQVCQFKEGDELIAPSHTFTSSVYPFLKKGARVVWADIDLKTRVITAETIRARITSRSRAVMVPHLYGFMADMPAIMQAADEHNLIVIEDVAQALGTELGGRKAGVYGHIGIYSLHSHKNITTLGEGGMFVARDPEIAAIIPMLRHNGHCAFDFPREDYWIPAMGNLDFPTLNGAALWPNNYCLGEIECALGIKLLDRIDTINHEKRRRALWFIDNLHEFPELEFHRVDSTRHNYHLLAARMANGNRDTFIREMAREKGIQCVVQYYPLNRYELYRKAGFGDASCPNADLFFDNMVSFPFHHWLRDEDLEFMLDAAKSVLTRLRQSK
jgi:dTDP-4-amino-4,6-dideoxygalactose transaminase